MRCRGCLRPIALVSIAVVGIASASPPPGTLPPDVSFPPCALLQPPVGMSYEDAYWNATVHNALSFYDAATDSVYLWPQGLQGGRWRNTTVGPTPRQLSCYGVLAPPQDVAAGGSLWAS